MNKTSMLPQAALHKSLLQPVVQPPPRDVAELVEQMEADYQFKLGTLVLKSLIETSSLSIDADDSPKSQAVAGNLKEHFVGVLPAALNAIAYGRAAFEKTYRWDANSGLALLQGLDYLPFEYTQLRLDDQGRFAGVELTVDETTHLLEPPRSWWFALDGDVLQPHGKSRYLGAAQQVLQDRKRLSELERIWYSRFVIGHGVARAPEPDELSTYDPADDGDNVDPMEVMREQCSRIEAGGVMVLSSERYADGTYLYDYLETEGQKDSAPLENRRRTLDAAALRSLGVPERAVTHDDNTGSYALAAVHREVLNKTCEGILSQLVCSYQKHVVDKLVELNWPADHRPTLAVTYQRLGDRSAALATELVKDLLSSSATPPLFFESNVDLEQLLKIAKVPVKPK